MWNLKLSIALPDQLRPSTCAESCNPHHCPLVKQYRRTAFCSVQMTLPPRTGALLDGSLKSGQLGKFCATCRQRRACRRTGAFKTFAMETRNRQANQQARRQSRKKGELPESGFFAQADPKGDSTILCQVRHDSITNAHVTSLLQHKCTFQEGGKTTQMLLCEEGDTLLTLFGTLSGRIR